MYVASASVRAFPLGRPRSNSSSDITSRIFYEQTVTNLVKQLIDVDGFLITGPSINSSNGQINGDLEFNLGGYWFKINSGTSIFPLNNSGQLIYEQPGTVGTGTALVNKTCYIYACIDLTNDVPIEIEGQDVNSNYEGLLFIASDSEPGNFSDHTYRLPIYIGKTNSSGSPVGGNWVIYSDSFIKFDISSLNITGIDGRHS